MPTVQHLTVRKMNVGDAELLEFDDLADTVHDQATTQQACFWRHGKGDRAPSGQAMMSPRQRRAGIEAANLRRQPIDCRCRFLHQKEIWPFIENQPSNIIDARAGAVQQVPTDNLHQ